MAITTIRIHPAIGITRVGDAPDDFFLGPERPGEPAIPPGGFKNGDCEVLRQGARFRVFGYDNNGVLVGEVTASMGAQITWTVHVANSKAVSPTTSPNSLNGTARNAGIAGAARQALVIDPGARTLATPNAIARFDTGSFTFPVNNTPTTVPVPLGEMRTDAEGRLIVLGGAGKAGSPDPTAPIAWFFDSPGWYDDVSDGPVDATVVLNGQTYVAEGAWVVCAPPDFAPAVATVHSLYDHLVQMHHPPAAGQVGAGGKPSYTKDIYPILQRASSLRWTRQSQEPVALDMATVATADAATRGAVRTQIGALPGGVTTQQADILQQWVAGNFFEDWVGAPPPAAISPDGLDRAALEACVGAPFYPGIEAGVWVDDGTRFSSFLRINRAVVSPGDVTQRMALPWQADFSACGGDGWWPAQRPNRVRVAGQPNSQDWARDTTSAVDMTEMVTQWQELGFVIPQGSEQLEVERCDVGSVFLRTPVVVVKVEQGPGGLTRQAAAPVVFEVSSPSAAVSLQFDGTLSAPFAMQTVSAVTAPSGSVAYELRLWVLYSSGAAPTGANPDTTSVVVKEVGGTRTWNIPIVGHTLARQKTLVGLVLDRSGSMSEDRGDGQTKIQSLREAAGIFVDAMLKEDAVTVVRYNHDAQKVVDPTVMDDQTGPASVREQVKLTINGADFDPQGATSIGDGIEVARQILDTTNGYAEKVLVVLTDGNENYPKMIADVSDSIDDRVFAVGFGKPQNTSTAALQTLTGNHGGYLLVTGLITPEKEHVLTKYFLQILAGVSNAEVVLDPSGELRPGDAHEIPFRLDEAAYGLDVYLLASEAQSIRFALRTPLGDIITPKVAAAKHPRMFHVPRSGMQLYRIAVPAEVRDGRGAGAGTWVAIVYRPGKQGELEARASLSVARASRESGASTAASYSVVVHAYSDLRARFTTHQKSLEPGVFADLGVTLSQWGIPLAPDRVWAEISGPDGALRRVELDAKAPGHSRGVLEALEAGTHQVRIRLQGRTLGGHLFEREMTRTVCVWPGGDRPPRPSTESGGGDPACDEARELLERLERCEGAPDEELLHRLHGCGFEREECLSLAARLAGRHHGSSPITGRVRKHLGGMLSRLLDER